MTAASELGPRLRAQRERRGIGIPKAADELRLDAWIVEALEAGEFDRVGAPVYAKGHLRRYAALVGLPDAEVEAALESLAAPAPPVELLDQVPFTSAPSRSLRELPWRPIATLAALAIIVVGVLWSKPWRARIGTPPPVVTLRANVKPRAAMAPPRVAAT
ncbi:MAG: helix-turn-helix domain-containing protein, partial [Gammaproteobacteria bacterium]|nr:helix-turn-helix domain-containing protein [Gammaproteobacteria bacterium]